MIAYDHRPDFWLVTAKGLGYVYLQRRWAGAATGGLLMPPTLCNLPNNVQELYQWSPILDQFWSSDQRTIGRGGGVWQNLLPRLVWCGMKLCTRFQRSRSAFTLFSGCDSERDAKKLADMHRSPDPSVLLAMHINILGFLPTTNAITCDKVFAEIVSHLESLANVRRSHPEDDRTTAMAVAREQHGARVRLTAPFPRTGSHSRGGAFLNAPRLECTVCTAPHEYSHTLGAAEHTSVRGCSVLQH